ncbi:MAG TPA: DUF192 domain-containing protein [Burkholderiaceae bacterium]|nr:DUF192 domain-containing protein [Burkholderiaceae bacterium]
MSCSFAGLTVYRATSFLARLRGLLARPPLQAGEAMYLAPCVSVHTCFMRYAIDVVFLDRAGRVLKVVEDLQPWRFAACSGAHATMELRAGQWRRHCERLGAMR